MRTVLIQNFHPANTKALVRDFLAIGYRVIMPADSWSLLHYFFDNSEMGGELLSFEQFYHSINDADLDILIGCFEQQDDMLKIKEKFKPKARILLHPAGNDVPYKHGISEHLISPDIQTFHNYPAKNKMLYLFNPIIFPEIDKHTMASFESKEIASFIHYYQKYWHAGWGFAQEFEKKYTAGKVFFYGYEARDGSIDNAFDVHKRMSELYFQLYFKDKDCYGNSVIESMSYGTPVVAIYDLIRSKTLGEHFLNKSNSIIGENVNDCLNQLRTMTFEKYETMCWLASETIYELTYTPTRLEELKSLLLS